MRLKIFNIIVLLIVSNITIGQSLEDYLVIAAENNPGLRSKFMQYQAALKKVSQVGALPDPEVSFGLFIKPMERYSGDQTASISLMQMFPWAGTLSAAKEEMSLMAKAEFESFNEAKSMLFYEVKLTWFELLRLNEETKILTSNAELFKTLENIAVSRFKSGAQSETPSGNSSMSQRSQAGATSRTGSNMSGMNMQTGRSSIGTDRVTEMGNMSSMGSMSGSGSMADVLRIKLEINELTNKIELLHESKIPLITRFNRLLNRSSEETVSLSEGLSESEIPIPYSDLLDSIISGNPMLKMLSSEEEAYIAQAKMNRKMGLPMVGIGLQYDIFRPGMNNTAMMNGKNMLMPMATVSVPLWRKKYRAAVQESQLMQKSISLQRQNITNQLIINYEDVIRDYRDAQRRVRLYKEQSVLASQVLNLLTVKYSVSGADFDEIIRVQQQLLDYELQYIKALFDGNSSVAKLEQLTGK